MSETIESIINELPIKVLLRIGGVVCPDDPAVKFIFDRAEAQYYHNRTYAVELKTRHGKYLTV